MNVMQNLPVNETGKKIQNYVFNYNDFLGKGNFSRCFKGINQITNQIVAIKIVQLNSLKSQKLQELLFQEIQILKKLNHPSVLKCYEIFTSNRNCYIITELCDEGDLQSKLKRKGTLTEAEANPIIRDVYQGLIYLAENNIVHRDFKSANIFLNNGHAKIADFGFAKEINHNFKDLNIGSPLYMAPEGIMDNIYGPKTQVWALGILVYQLFHGRTPNCHCKTQQELKAGVTTPLHWNQLRPDLADDIKEFILTCLQVNEQKRPSMQDLQFTPYMKRLQIINNSKSPGKSLQFDLRTSSRANTFQPLKLQYMTNNQKPNFFTERNNFQNRGGRENYNVQHQNRVNRPRQNSTDQFVAKKNIFRSVNMRNQYNYDPPFSGSPQRQIFPLDSRNKHVIYPMQYSPHKNINNGQPRFLLNSHRLDGLLGQQSQSNMSGNNQSYPFNQGQNTQSPLNTEQFYTKWQGYPLESFQNHQPSNIINRKGLINSQLKIGNVISTPLSFKEGICFIHHCRLLFKFLCFYRESSIFQQHFYVKTCQYLLHLLWQLELLLNRGEICATGQKAQMKLQKFEQVNRQYSQKYKKQFISQGYTNLSNQASPQTSVRFLIVNVFPNIQMRIQKQISQIGQREILNQSEENLIIMGHLALVVIKSLQQIERARQEGNFKGLTKSKHIQTVLNTPKQNFTPLTYAEYRKTLLS